MSDTILVTGASGHLGRKTVEYLLDRKAGTIIAASRDPAKIADLGARGAELREADFEDPSSLEQAFAGVDKLLIVSTDALDRPGRRLDQHRAAIAAATKAKTGQIFYTSMPNPATSPVTFAPDHLGTEAALKESGLLWTILRNSWYMENLFHAMPASLKTGQWYTSAGAGKLGHIARDDIAAALAGALSGMGKAGATYTLTGAEALTADEIAAIVSAETGLPLGVVNLTDEQLAGGMKAAGVPEFLVPTFVSFDQAIRQGALADVTGDAEALSGSKPRSFASFATANKAAFLPA